MRLLLFVVSFLRCWRFFTEVHRVIHPFWKSYMFLCFFSTFFFIPLSDLRSPIAERVNSDSFSAKFRNIPYVLYLFFLAPAVTECSSGSDTDLRPGDQAKPFLNLLMMSFSLDPPPPLPSYSIYLFWGGNLAYSTRHSLGLRGPFLFMFFCSWYVSEASSRQCCGSGLNGVPESGSKRKKFIIFSFLSAGCSLLQILIQKR